MPLIDAPGFREKKRKPKPLRESTIEKAHGKAHDGLHLKFVSPGFNGAPDRIKLSFVPVEHRELVARYFRFVEYKAPGEEPEPHQLTVHGILRDLGFTVDVIDQLPEK